MQRTAELRTLKSFVTVAREGNVSRAAGILHLTQPAISLQLKRLSEDTGLTLFNRTAKGLELTRDGEALLQKAERVFAALAEFDSAARRIQGDVRGVLRIGTIVDPDFIRLGQLLVGMVDTYPDLQTELIHGMSGEVISRLQRNQIDVGYFLSAKQSINDGNEADACSPEMAIHRHQLTTFTYCVIAPSGWEKRVKGKRWQELVALPWIGTPQNSVHTKLMEQVLPDENFERNIVALVDQEPSMLAMVRSGVGLSLCRESIALYEQQARGIVIADQVKVEASLNFGCLQSRVTHPNIVGAFEILKSIWPLV